MAKNGFLVFDSDMHIMEPPDLWQRYIDERYKSAAPVGITSENVRDLRISWPDLGRRRRRHRRGWDRHQPQGDTTTRRTRSFTGTTLRADGTPTASLEAMDIGRASTSPSCSPAGD